MGTDSRLVSLVTTVPAARTPADPVARTDPDSCDLADPPPPFGGIQIGRASARPIIAMDPFSHASVMAIDVYRSQDHWRVDVDVPGIDLASINVERVGQVLIIRAYRSRRASSLHDLEFAEREHGSFRRELWLSEALDVDNLQVTYDLGVLSIAVPIIPL